MRLQENFDVNQYVGKWYEWATDKNIWYKGDCVQAKYTKQSDGTIEVSNSLNSD